MRPCTRAAVHAGGGGVKGKPAKAAQEHLVRVNVRLYQSQVVELKVLALRRGIRGGASAILRELAEDFLKKEGAKAP